MGDVGGIVGDEGMGEGDLLAAGDCEDGGGAGAAGGELGDGKAREGDGEGIELRFKILEIEQDDQKVGIAGGVRHGTRAKRHGCGAHRSDRPCAKRGAEEFAAFAAPFGTRFESLEQLCAGVLGEIGHAGEPSLS